METGKNISMIWCFSVKRKNWSYLYFPSVFTTITLVTKNSYDERLKCNRNIENGEIVNVIFIRVSNNIFLCFSTCHPDCVAEGTGLEPTAVGRYRATDRSTPQWMAGGGIPSADRITPVTTNTCTLWNVQLSLFSVIISHPLVRNIKVHVPRVVLVLGHGSAGAEHESGYSFRSDFTCFLRAVGRWQPTRSGNMAANNRSPLVCT